mgnify:FL=1|tara:strand:+ start:409 stop:612 length:204 start_codon:yes stop_codon:yes gene_type:complete
MSKNDLQETNVAKEKKEKTLTIDDIRAAIIGDQNKIILLNVFDNLVNENKSLRTELEKFQEVKSFEE